MPKDDFTMTQAQSSKLPSSSALPSIPMKSNIGGVNRTCHAAVLESFREPLCAREFSVPERASQGEILVKTEMAGICGTDVHLWKGELPIRLPVILGHETVGTIVSLGEGVEKDWTGADLRVGDRITWNSTTSCGQCYYCAVKRQPTRCPQRRAYGIGYPCDQAPYLLGGYAEYHVLMPRATTFRLPDELATETLIGAGCGLLTAIHGIERTGLEWGDVVVIQGSGTVGISALAVARAAGAARVLVIGGPRSRLDSALIFGADAALDIDAVPGSRERIEWVRRETGGYGADAVIECVGHPGAVVEGMEMCRDGGKYLILGHYCDAGSVLWNPHIVTRKQLQVFGSWSSEPRHLKSAIDFLVRDGARFPFGKLVTHRYGLRDAQKALETTGSWQCGKCVLVPGEG